MGLVDQAYTLPMGLLTELRRRNVLRMAALYLGAAWLVLQVADIIIDRSPIPESIGPVILGILAVGFPIALVLSWFYELSPEGISREPDDDVEQAITRVPGRRIDFIIISILCAAVILFAYDKWWMSGPPERSVAVLPFVNMSGDPDNEYLSDGITETLLNALAQLPDLKVTARTSSFFFKGQDIDIRKIAAKLGVGSVLEGSVQRSGNRIRVVAQLIEAKSGFHLWSNTYDREMSEIFALQDDIASSVALAMQLTLAGEADQGGGQIETVGTRNVAAYDKYLQGMQQKNLGHTAPLLLAEILFREALALDPYYHEARLQLAYSYLRQLDWGVITATEANARVNPLLDRLLEEWPDGGRALAPMYAAHLIIEGFMDLDSASMDVEKQLAGLATAIGRTPNETGLYIALAILLKNTYRTTEALQWLDRGIALDPLNKRLHYFRGVYGLDIGDLDGAEASQARVIEIDPHTEAAIASSVAWHNQQYTEWTAINYSIIFDPLDYETPVFFAMNHYLLGLMDEGDKYLQRATLMAPEMAVVKATKLYQLILQDDHSRTRELSESMLRDDIDNRRGAYKFALIAFLSAMSDLDKLDEALIILEELRPGVSSPDFYPLTFKDQVLQYHAVLALAQRQSQQENLIMLDSIVPRWDESFPFWRNSPRFVAPITMARGQTKAAVKFMLDDLDDGLAEFNYFSQQLPYQHISYYKALTLESPIAARLEELNAEAKKVGEEAWAYIVENQLQL